MGFDCSTIAVLKWFLNKLPFVGVLVLFSFSYNVFIIRWLYPITILGSSYFWLFMIYHILGTLCMWCYLVSALVKSSMHYLQKKTYIDSNEFSNQKRYCKKCNVYKEARMHHCSWCERCIAKFDHHCPWIGNCVGAHNYKSFLLLLFYSFLFSAFVTYSLMFNLSSIPKTIISSVWILIALGLGISIAVLILLIMHLYLLFTNSTTLEYGQRFSKSNSCYQIESSQYDLGWKANFKSVFGEDVLFWFLPIYMSSISIQSNDIRTELLP